METNQPVFETPDDAAMYLHNHWEKITGTSRRHMHEESHWPVGAQKFIDATGFDVLEFQDAWTCLLE